MIFSHSNIPKDPRVLRQIKWLRELGFDEISTVGMGERSHGVDFHFEIPSLSFLLRYFGYLIRGERRRFQFFFGRFLDRHLKHLELGYELVVVNQIEYLPWEGFESNALKEIPVYLDIHEDNINDADRGPLEKFAFRKYWQWQLKQLVKFVGKRDIIVITSVEEVIANSYSDLFRLPVGILYNAPDENDLTPTPVDESAIRLLHHGMGTKGRGIETTIRAIRRLDDRFTLDLILFPTPLFKIKIEFLSRLLGVRKRINILPGVPLADLIPIVNKYDLSVIVLSGVIPGHLNSLPNKLFESIQAKVAIITGPNPSMARLVQENEIGLVMNSWSVDDLVLTLGQVSKGTIEVFKSNTISASQTLSSQKSKELFVKLTHQLLS